MGVTQPPRLPSPCPRGAGICTGLVREGENPEEAEKGWEGRAQLPTHGAKTFRHTLPLCLPAPPRWLLTTVAAHHASAPAFIPAPLLAASYKFCGWWVPSRSLHTHQSGQDKPPACSLQVLCISYFKVYTDKSTTPPLGHG